jgi:hypothetical protein
MKERKKGGPRAAFFTVAGALSPCSGGQASLLQRSTVCTMDQLFEVDPVWFGVGFL